MINLDATDVLEGIASVDAVVKFTVSGRDETDGLISKEGTAGNTNTEFYTAVGITLIYSVTLYNSHSSAVTLTLNKDPANAGILYPYFSVSLGVGYSLVFDGQRFTTMDASGNITSSLANPMDAAGELIYGGANGVMTALDAGATTKILVGGGAAAPVWTEATGTGAPVRAGAPTFTGQPIIPTINLTGGQIAFPATAVPSADANTLDDYEEGNFTATVTCVTSGSYTLNAAKDLLAYTKIGRLINMQGELEITGENSPSGLLKISLPFTVANLSENAEGSAGSIVLFNHGGTIPNGIFVAPSAGNNFFYLMNIADNGTLSYIDNTDVDTAFTFMMTFPYIGG